MKRLMIVSLFLGIMISARGKIANHLVISEIRYDERSGIDEEFLELYNPTSQTIELNSFFIAYKSKEGDSWRTKLTFDETHQIQPYGFLLWGGSDVETVPDIIHASSLGLGNSGGHLAIFQDDSTLVDLIAWEGGLHPEGESDAGKTEDGGSLERKACEGATAFSMSTGGDHAGIGNGWDSNQNGLDFVVHELAFCNPQNSKSVIEKVVAVPTSGSSDSELGLIEWPSVKEWKSSGVVLEWQSNLPCLSCLYFGLNGLLGDSLVNEGNDVLHEFELSGFQTGDLITYQVKLYTDTSSTRFLPGQIAMPTPESSGEISVYFNGSVDEAYAKTMVASGNRDLAAQLVSFIDSAQYTLDFCFMKLTEWDVRDALIRAKERGVLVRVVCDDAYYTYDEIKALQTVGIPVISDGFGANNGNEGIMHHKFAISDYQNGLNPEDDRVWTGSYNATYYGNNPASLENVLVIEDQSLAAVYTASFNVMWGSDSDEANPDLARFGKNRMAQAPALLKIKDTSIDVVMSPSSASVTSLRNAIDHISESCLFSVYSFTHDSIAASILNHVLSSRCYVAGLWDEGQIEDDGEYAQWPNFHTQSSNMFWPDGDEGKLHHKYLIGDALENTGHGFVISGSMNWSYSGEKRNDENVIILRNDDIANQYLQEFAARFQQAGGTLPDFESQIVHASEVPQHFELYNNFPNPFNHTTQFQFYAPGSDRYTLCIYDINGRVILKKQIEIGCSGMQNWAWHGYDQDGNEVATGVYLFSISNSNQFTTQKILLMK